MEGMASVIIYGKAACMSKQKATEPDLIVCF